MEAAAYWLFDAAAALCASLSAGLFDQQVSNYHRRSHDSVRAPQQSGETLPQWLIVFLSHFAPDGPVQSLAQAMKQYFETDALPLLRLHYSLEKPVIFLCKLLHLAIRSKEPAPIKRVRKGAFCLAAANLN